MRCDKHGCALRLSRALCKCRRGTLQSPESLANLHYVEHQSPLLSIYANEAGGSFLLVHVLGDVSALVVSPLQEKQSMDYCRLVAFVSETRLRVCVCVVCFVCMHACLQAFCNNFVCMLLERSLDNCLSAPLLFDTDCADMDFSVLVLGLIPVFITFDHLVSTCTNRETWIFISLCLITAYYLAAGLRCLRSSAQTTSIFQIF